MLTRIYTPPVVTYPNYKVKGNQDHDPSQEKESEAQARQFTAAIGTQQVEAPNADQAASTQQQPSSGGMSGLSPGVGLQSLGQRERIPIQTVLQDVNSTLNALGVDENLRQEVASYLSVVQLQAEKDVPEVPYMKHSLKVAASVLDRFITKTLGQPSTVVKDWVDALLLKPIDYKNYKRDETNLPSKETESSLALDDSTTSAQLSVTAQVSSASQELNPEDKAALKALLKAGKSQYVDKDYAAALTSFDQGRQVAQTMNQPGIEGRFSLWLGKTYDAQGEGLQNKDKALLYYDQAAQAFEQAGQPQQQAKALYAMASIYDERGVLDKAQRLYEQVLVLDQSQSQQALPADGLLSKTYNDLGGVYLRQGQAQKAIDTLMLAYHHANANPAESDGVSVLGNLGLAYRHINNYNKAADTYRLAMKQAKQVGDKQAYTQTLQQLVVTYQEANEPELAAKAQAKLASLLENDSLQAA